MDRVKEIFMTGRFIAKMIDFSAGHRVDVCHFLKVYAYAKTIGELEGLDEAKRTTLELTAIVHDIACPVCREKYASTNGKLQERESEAVLHPFLEEFDLPPQLRERIIFLVCHHHSYEGVDGIDWRILLEADYLVNADESRYSSEQIRRAEETVFETATGKRLLRSLFPEAFTIK